MNKQQHSNYSMEIIEIYSKGSMPTGYFKIKNGEVIDFRYGSKKSKVIIYPVDLEGILKFDNDGWEIKYKVKITYGFEDLFDVNKYVEYMKRKELIRGKKREYVNKREFNRAVFDDLMYMNSEDEIIDYFITEIGVSPKVYKKAIKKKKIDEIRAVMERAEEAYSNAKQIIEVYNNLATNNIDLNEILKKSTGKTLQEIKELNDYEFNLYKSKVARDLANLYIAKYGDEIGARVVERVVKIALDRAKENPFSSNLIDYLIRNENYNEIRDIAKNEYENLIEGII